VIQGHRHGFAFILGEREHVRRTVFATVRLVQRLDIGVIREKDAQLVLFMLEVAQHPLRYRADLTRTKGDG
jgi:hypothetical protein